MNNIIANQTVAATFRAVLSISCRAVYLLDVMALDLSPVQNSHQVETLLLQILPLQTRPLGRHDVTFDASGLSSGTFIYRLEAGDYVETRSMMFLK